MFGSQLFWYKLIFMTELLSSEALFVHRLKRRRFFAARAVGATAICYSAALLFPVPVYNAAYSSFLFIALFAVTALCIKLCFDEPFINIIFCGVAAYSVQHIAFQCYNIIIVATGIARDTPLGIYGDSEPYYTVTTGLVYAMTYIFCYWIAYLCFARRIERNGNLRIKSVALLLILAAVVLVSIVINAVVTYNSYSDYNKTFILCAGAGITISCVLALCLQFGLLSNKNLETELNKVYHLWREEQKQFAASKANIDLINLKCHDLKHQIRKIGSGQVNERALKEIEDTVNIYDCAVKTGNSALDIILTEKSLLCGSNHVSFTAIADGEKLGFIADVDIYTLFGNALDNAIEAVMRLPEDRRVVSLTTKQSGKLFSVSLRNFYDGEVRLVNGLPVTTKSDSGYHGFGVKSIKEIAERYGGDVSVVAEDGVFTLNVLFTLGDGLSA